MCSYPINRAFVPESKRHVVRKKLRGEFLESNLAAAVEYLDYELEGGEDGSEDSSEEAAQSRDDGSWNIGAKDKEEFDEEADPTVPVLERTKWLARALLDEGLESRASDKTRTGTGSEAAGKVHDGTVEPVQPRKRKRHSSSRRTQQYCRRVVEDLIRSPQPEYSIMARKGVLSGRRSTIPTAHVKMMKVMKNASQALKSTGTWTVASGTSTQDQGSEAASVASDTDENGENGESGDRDDSDMKAKTPAIPKYRKQIANTFRPWVARKGEKVIPSACDLPETTFLQALHYYASYYYTHASPSPDMFEAMDLTSHIALGMIIQEIISDFAFKLGKESQLEDIRVKVDKLVAAQHGDKWDENFVEYLKSLTADGALSPSKKRLQSRSDEGSAESADDAGSDTDMKEDSDEDMSHGFQSWDELEGLRRTTTLFGVDTMKELVNRTTFDFNEGDASEVDNGDDGDLQETHLDQHETDRQLSALTLDMDPDSRSLSGSGINRTIAENTRKATQPKAIPRKEPAFDVDSDAGDDLEQVSNESDLESMDLASDEEDRLGQGDDEGEDDDMPQVDMTQSVLSQLSNNRFGSQFTFGLDDPTDESEDEGEDEHSDVDDLSGRTLVQSQALLDESDESSEAESDSSDSDSEPAVKKEQEKEKDESEDDSEDDSEKESVVEKKEKDNEDYRQDERYAEEKETKRKGDNEEEESAAEENMNVDMDNSTLDEEDEEDEEDHSLSVLTQVSKTRFGSAFTSNQDDSSSEEDFGFNIASGRFLAQSQVVQSDSDDSSESQDDSTTSESEQEKEEVDESEDSVTAENKDDNASSKESHAQDKDEDEEEDEKEDEEEEKDKEEETSDDGERTGRADTIELKGTPEESDVEMEGTEEALATQNQSRVGAGKEGDKAEQEGGSIDEDQGGQSQPVFTTVSATRFGSMFSARYNASDDDDDESEDDGGGYANTLSQVVLDDSTTDEDPQRETDSSDDDDDD
ncbi:hypothetical protein BGZ95_002395 [Linnemannia exigua]|uniref:Uncharacterized protein n=1 Tax=Linnemannia exigua TaxID=604196 RepID=A0AAD4D612_9FUNG|nr:hypothetical protein BGZ95_002395 [Linnemannia exigua]